MGLLPLQLARVSNSLRTNVANQSIARTQSQLLRVQNELATGKRLNAPSDSPGESAIVLQLRKTLEQRDSYLTNLKRANSHLSEVDSTLGEMTDLLRQAQELASANVGSDVTSEQRSNAATIIDSIYSRALNLANKQFEGVYLFGGDRATDKPFENEGGGVKFVGSTTVLQNAYDENTLLPFMVNGADVFGAMSTRIEGTSDLTPDITLSTRLSDLRGAGGAGVQKGSILLGNGTDSVVIDLSSADTIQDVVAAINGAALGNITAAIGPDGDDIEISTSGTDDITVEEVGGGTTAADLGILTITGGGAGVAIDGDGLQAKITNLTPLSALRGGTGLDLSGLSITNGLLTADVDLSAATTVEDLLNAINGSDTAVLARINSAGTGIDIVNPTQGTEMRIAENGGTTAEQLGVRSFHADTPLSELNDGRGVNAVDGDEFTIRKSDGTTFGVDISGAMTIQDVMDAIAAADGTGETTVAFATTGNGIVITDTAGGPDSPTITPANFSTAVADLGLDEPAVGNVITGSDVNPVTSAGVFSHLSNLRDALRNNNLTSITTASEDLAEDLDQVVRVRGETGARVQELEQRQTRIEDQNVATASLLSSLEDVDITEAVARFQTLQTALQANLQSSGAILNLSLLDFLG